MAGRRAGAGQMLLSHRLAFSVTWSHVSLVKRSLKWLPHDMSCSQTPEFLCLPGLTRSCVQYTQYRCRRATTLWNPKAPRKRRVRGGHREHLLARSSSHLDFLVAMNRQVFCEYLLSSYICPPGTKLHANPTLSSVPSALRKRQH